MFTDALSFAVDYVEEFSRELKKQNIGLSKTQRHWLSFCLTAMLLTGVLCWRRFAQMSAGAYSVTALSSMFCKSKIAWDALLPASVKVLLRWFKLIHGVLVIDDTDHRRAKTTKRIHGAHKVFDKKTGGYFNGQCLMFLLLVTPVITFPVGFCFYRPDPKFKAWKKEEERLIKEKVARRDRPKAPPADPDYPSKAQIALKLIAQFHANHPDFVVRSVLADAAFGNAHFLQTACANAHCTQCISQIKGSQSVTVRGRKQSVAHYFDMHAPTPTQLTVRGGQVRKVWVGSARLTLNAHGCKRFIIALRHEDEKGWRYLVASDLTWRTQDITQCYTLRWLVETFFEDWKRYDGWANLAKQPDIEGSLRGVTLSLLLDHALLVHPQQLASLKSTGTAVTVGSLQRSVTLDAFVHSVRQLLEADDPLRALERLIESFKKTLVITISSKHMANRDIGRQEPTPSLVHRYGKHKSAPSVACEPEPLCA